MNVFLDIVVYGLCICFAVLSIMQGSVYRDIGSKIINSKAITINDAVYRCDKILSDVGNKRSGK